MSYIRLSFYFFIFFLYYVFKIWCVSYTDSTSPFRQDMYQDMYQWRGQWVERAGDGGQRAGSAGSQGPGRDSCPHLE